MKDEEIKSGLYRDKKGMYIKLSEGDLKELEKMENRTIRHKER